MADLIYRQAAIDALLHNQEVYSNNFGTDAIDKYTTAIIANDVETIAQLPSAQPERKTGRWQYVDYGGFGNWHCTACRKICICNGDYDFCPNCGAKMEDSDGEG